MRRTACALTAAALASALAACSDSGTVDDSGSGEEPKADAVTFHVTGEPDLTEFDGGVDITVNVFGKEADLTEKYQWDGEGDWSASLPVPGDVHIISMTALIPDGEITCSIDYDGETAEGKAIGSHSMCMADMTDLATWRD